MSRTDRRARTTRIPRHAAALRDGPLRPVVEAAEQRGISISGCNAIRWVRSGLRGIPLPAVKVGGCWRTTQAAFDDWLVRVSSHDGPDTGPEIDSTATERVLASHGLGRDTRKRGGSHG